MTKETEALERVAAALDVEADRLRRRAIETMDVRGTIPDDEVDRWAVAFSTSYQTLRGIAAALRASSSPSLGKG